MKTQEIAIILGYLLYPEKINEFIYEVNNSPFSLHIKEYISNNFYSGCNINNCIQNMMCSNVLEIKSVGFVFDWILRHRIDRKKNQNIVI